MVPFIFKRTMARVEDGQGQVTYRCMACVRRELPYDKLIDIVRWFDVHQGSGMFAQTWHLVQTRQPCAGCEVS